MATAPSHGLIAPAKGKATLLHIVREKEAAAFREALDPAQSSWLTATSASNRAGHLWLLPNETGLAGVALVVSDPDDPFAYGELSAKLPAGTYQVAPGLDPEARRALCLGFGLGRYRFSRYSKDSRAPRLLVWPDGVDRDELTAALEATYLARDLVNTPASDMGPADLEKAARELGKLHGAKVSAIVADALLRQNFPMIHAVGRAAGAGREPRLIDLTWGSASAPKVTLVGKGVCFDTGGLDLKPPQHMKLMKKDMGGAALVLALGHRIMAAKLPVRLRILIPAVENSVSGNAMRPLDILGTRKGITVEVGDTDAEGRLVLGDALTLATEEDPELVIDAATLTGAARVALGTAMPAIFATEDGTWASLSEASQKTFDPLWRLPLYEPYRKKLLTKMADLSNVGDSYGGAITAALFLEEFVRGAKDWIHMDTMGFNLEASPGRPAGGEALGLFALFELVRGRFGHQGPTRRATKAKSKASGTRTNKATGALKKGR